MANFRFANWSFLMISFGLDKYPIICYNQPSLFLQGGEKDGKNKTGGMRPSYRARLAG